ncbi:LysE family translocator [Corynebacterium urogenitale]
MTIGAYLGLLGAWIAAIASPGPDTVQLIRLGSRSRRTAIVAALGICSGNILWPVVTMAGLAALIAAFPWILAILYIGGGLFLLKMGIGSFRGGLADYRSRSTVPARIVTDGDTSGFQGTATPSQDTATSCHQMSDCQAWKLGLATNLSNPKALLFFGAVFAQFLPVDISLTERLAVLLMMTVVGLMWFCGFAWAVSLPLWAEKLQRANPIIEMAAGVIFALLASFLLYEGILTVSDYLR